MANRYEFAVEIIEKAERKKEQTELVFVEEELKREIVTISLNPPDVYGEFEILFDKFVKMPGNCTEWTSHNEGGKKMLKILYEPSEET